LLPLIQGNRSVKKVTLTVAAGHADDGQACHDSNTHTAIAPPG
jgi:hypothetical protein